MSEIFTSLLKEVEQYISDIEESRKAANKVNQAKTRIKKLFTQFLKVNNYLPGTSLRYKEFLFSFTKAEGREVILPEKWFALFQEGSLTEEQFLRCLKVSKTDAVKILGDDQVRAIEEPAKSSPADLRMVKTSYDASEQQETEVIAIKPKAKVNSFRQVKSGTTGKLILTGAKRLLKIN